MYGLAEDGKVGLVSDGRIAVPAGGVGVLAGSATLPGVAGGDCVPGTLGSQQPSCASWVGGVCPPEMLA